MRVLEGKEGIYTLNYRGLNVMILGVYSEFKGLVGLSGFRLTRSSYFDLAESI